MPNWLLENFLRYNQILRASSEPVQRRRQVQFVGGSLVDDGSSTVLTVSGSSQSGPTGDQGPQGPIGPEGAQGPAGANGANGVDGQPGSNGSDGSNGSNGSNGLQGPPGADGAGAFSKMTVAVFTSGSGTYFPPQGTPANRMIIIAIGGGGGGSGEVTTPTTGRFAGGGGGSGGTAINFRILTAPSVQYVVGAGGALNLNGFNSSAGDGLTLILGEGGKAGFTGNTGVAGQAVGGAGGEQGDAFDGELNFPGQRGTTGRMGFDTVMGGMGGVPFFGGRILGHLGEDPTGPSQLIAYGAGGRGGSSDGSIAQPGVLGSSGAVIIVTTGV